MADETLSVAEGQFRSYFERWERLEEAKRVASDDLKAFFSEMKGEGYNPKAARVVFRDEVSDQAEAQEFEAICDLYRAALRKPRAHPAPAREKTLDNFGSYAEGKGMSGEQTARDTLDRYPVVMAALQSAEPTQEQPETAPEKHLTAPSQRDDDAARQSGEEDAVDPVVPIQAHREVSHSPAVLPGKADKTSEAVVPPEASSLVAPAGTKHADTNFGSDPLNDAPSADADQAGAIVGHPMSAVAPAALSAMNAKTKGDVIRLLRPFCRHADDLGKCGGQSSKHCSDCEKLKRAAAIREDA